MINIVAAFFRLVNSRLVGEGRWLVQKLIKIFFGISGIVHRSKLGMRDEFVVINNFDTNLNLKINCSWSMGFAIYWTGFHEFHEFLFLNKFLKIDMVFVDVGANLGEYSIFAAKRTTNGKVLAFEPLPKMTELLEENIKLNGFSNVQIFKYGLANIDGVLPIHEIEDQHEGLSTFFPGTRKSRDVIKVPLKVFDNDWDLYGVNRIDFIKIDIEGGELEALRGARKSIVKFKPVVMVEINQETYQAAGYSVDDVYQFFTDLAYHPFEIDKQGDLKRVLQRPVFENIVFVPS